MDICTNMALKSVVSSYKCGGLEMEHVKEHRWEQSKASERVTLARRYGGTYSSGIRLCQHLK